MKSRHHFHVFQLCLVDFLTDPRPSRIRNHLLNDANLKITSWHPKIENNALYMVFRKIQNRILELVILIFLKLSFINVCRYLLENYWPKYLSKVPSLNNANIVIIHDIELLPIAAYFKKRRSFHLVFDLREYYTEQHNSTFYHRLIVKSLRSSILKIYSQYVDEFITVSFGLQLLYKNNFNIDCKILMSTPSFQEVNSPDRLITSPLKIVHHGVANRNRQLEKMIEIVSQVKREIIFDFYLTGDKDYISFLSNLITQKGLANIRIKPPVALEDLVHTLRQYDVGFFYVEPLTLNLLHCLPNKLFEFIHAGLCVITGPSPDMVKITSDYGVGYHSNDFNVSSVVALIDTLTDDEIMSAMKSSVKASQCLNFETQFQPFKESWCKVCYAQLSSAMEITS